MLSVLQIWYRPFIWNFRIGDCRYEPCFTGKLIFLPWQIKINTLVDNNDGRKIIKYYMNINKYMRSPDGIFQTNKKLSVEVHTKNVCKLWFDDHLLLTLLDQTQSDVVVFK